MDAFQGSIVTLPTAKAAKAFANRATTRISTPANPWLVIGRDTGHSQHDKRAGAGVVYKREWLAPSDGRRSMDTETAMGAVDLDELVEKAWAYSYVASSTAGELVGMAHALHEVISLLLRNAHKLQPNCTLVVILLGDCREALRHVEAKRTPSRSRTLVNVPPSLIEHIRAQSQTIQRIAGDIGIEAHLSAHWCPRNQALHLARADRIGLGAKTSGFGLCNTTGNMFARPAEGSLMDALGPRGMDGFAVPIATIEEARAAKSGTKRIRKQGRALKSMTKAQKDVHARALSASLGVTRSTTSRSVDASSTTAPSSNFTSVLAVENRDKHHQAANTSKKRKAGQVDQGSGTAKRPRLGKRDVVDCLND